MRSNEANTPKCPTLSKVLNMTSLGEVLLGVSAPSEQKSHSNKIVCSSLRRGRDPRNVISRQHSNGTSILVDAENICQYFDEIASYQLSCHSNNSLRMLAMTESFRTTLPQSSQKRHKHGLFASAEEYQRTSRYISELITEALIANAERHEHTHITQQTLFARKPEKLVEDSFSQDEAEAVCQVPNTSSTLCITKYEDIATRSLDLSGNESQSISVECPLQLRQPTSVSRDFSRPQIQNFYKLAVSSHWKSEGRRLNHFSSAMGKTSVITSRIPLRPNSFGKMSTDANIAKIQKENYSRAHRIRPFISHGTRSTKTGIGTTEDMLHAHKKKNVQTSAKKEKRKFRARVKELVNTVSLSRTTGCEAHK